MILVIDRTNMKLHASVLRSYAALRYKVFISEMGWSIPCRDPGFETDQFDDDNAIYLIVMRKGGEIAGGARLLDTSRRSLLREVFPYLVHGSAPADPQTFEVTRFVADSRSTGDRSSSICMELLWGLQAYGVWADLTHLVSVSYIGLEPILRRAGYRFSRLGGTQEMDGSQIVALKHDVNPATLERLRRRLDVPSGVALPAPASEITVAAAHGVTMGAPPRQQPLPPVGLGSAAAAGIAVRFALSGHGSPASVSSVARHA